MADNKDTKGNRCAYCDQEMQSIFGTGRSLICRNPKCKADKGADWVDDDPTDPFGFTIRDPDEKEKKKLDLEILELDFDDISID